MPQINNDKIIKRVFTKELENNPNKTVYDLFDYKNVDVSMKHYKTNETIFEMKDLEFPVNYSQNACDIIASKYFRREGVPNGVGHERSMKEIVDRMVTFWADALKEEGLIKSEEDYQIFYDELAYALLNQMWAPNSPQWFNSGLNTKYGITGESDGLYYFDEEEGKVVESKDRYSRSQTSACFILSIDDKLLGPHSITDHYVSETKLFKGGSGVGTNFSTIRGEGEKISSGGQSSGLMSFLLGLDRNAGSIKSGGTTRRAAKMVIVDVDHPEIEKFIEWKAKEEKKVAALSKMGYDGSMEGEAYQTVSGQNSNNSVRVNKQFMEAVENLDLNPNQTYKLKGRVDHSKDREVKVQDIWNEINECAWECADPGLQFDDIYNAWHTCPAGLDGDINNPENRINATNPCSEYAFLDNTACNLASINVYKFLDGRNIKVDEYTHLVGLVQMVLEASIARGQFPTEDVAERSYLFRTTGLGLANYASLFMELGIPYDSPEARNLAAALTGIMTGHSYKVSAQMAKEVGPFKKYGINKKYMDRVIRNHARVAGALTDEFEAMDYEPIKVDHHILDENGFGEVSGKLIEEWNDAIEYGNKYGYRNAQVSVIAPTGTISFAMDCGATSIEPFYSNVAYKKLSGGGSMEIVNPVIEKALLNLGYSAEQTAEILDFILAKDEYGMRKHLTLDRVPYLKEEHKKIFDTANEIRPEGHVLMVSSVTPMISGSISKTVNLPNSATVDDIKKINLLAYKTGSKAIALYRDGCKFVQPLSSGNEVIDNNADIDSLNYNELVQVAKGLQKELEQVKQEVKKLENNAALASVNPSVPQLKRNKPEGIRESRTHSLKIGDIELYVTVGYYPDHSLCEIFVSTDKDGTVVKGLLAGLSKTISHMLQYGISPKDISKILRHQRYEPAGIVQRHPYIKFATSISDLIAKVIDIECGDYSSCEVKPKGYIDPNQQITFLDENHINLDDDKIEKIYGEVCSNCGSDNLVRNGTCKVCADCGTTTGCS